MELFKKQTHINFLALRKWATVLSLVLFFISIASLIFNGLNWGLDFTGGTQLQLSFSKPADLSDIRQQLKQAGFHDAVVQSYGTSHDVLISVPSYHHEQVPSQRMLLLLKKNGASLKLTEFIGPQVGEELAIKGTLGILIALLATMIYIAFRFEYRFAIGAVAALIHDPLLILGVFSIFHIEFNLTTLAAVLAVIGYSLNDTIVIFDRIRENFRKIRKGTSVEIVNLSINQTLSRTIMTSAMTLLIVMSLFIFGGPMIHSFSTALIIGIVVGTYSSIYIAGALAVWLGLDRRNLFAVPAKPAIKN